MSVNLSLRNMEEVREHEEILLSLLDGEFNRTGL